MTLTPVPFRPGLHSDNTDYAGEGTWIDGNRIRFRGGLPESIGGWQQFTDETFTGVPRAMHIWSEIDGSVDIAVGSSERLEILRNQAIIDITPQRASGSLTDPFDTTSGSSTVAVTDTAHGCIVGDTVLFSGATAVGGLTLDGYYSVTSVTSADVYSVDAGSAASSTANGGGTVGYVYLISIGNVSAAPGYGWGAGGWGNSTWDTPRTSSTVIISLGTWSIDNWGEDLLALPRGGSLAAWDASSPSNRAAIISAAPTPNIAMVVSAEDRHVILLGAGGDPMNVAWCKQEDYDVWTPAADNDAESRRLLEGSTILAGLRATGEIVIWTDAAVYSMVYTAGPFVFSLRRVGASGGLLGIHAMTEINGVTYYIGAGQFYAYTGRIQVIPCDILREIFDDPDDPLESNEHILDTMQSDKIECATISAFNEVIWFYPSVGGTGEVDRYVKLNYLENVWDFGALDRPAFTDQGIYSTPMGVSPDGVLYMHETGRSADGAALDSYIESGDFDMGDGDDVMLIKRMIPDFKLIGLIEAYIKVRKYPNSAQTTKGPYEISSTTVAVDFKARGRQATLRLESSGTDTFWRLGRLRFDIQPDGKR